MSATNTIRLILVALTLAAGVFSSSRSRAADLPARPVEPAALLAPAPTPFFVRLGATAVLPDVDIKSSIAGAPVLGGGGRIDAVPAAYFEAGYYLTRNIAASISGGFPPTFATVGTGSLAASGVLYRAVVGLPVFAVTYHLDNFGPVRPYAGVGIGYGIAFRNESASVLNPLLRNEAAFVIVGGIDYDLTPHWGIFVDVKKAFLTQRFTGTAQVPVNIPGLGIIVARLPTEASVRTDPVLISAGVSYRF